MYSGGNLRSLDEKLKNQTHHASNTEEIQRFCCLIYIVILLQIAGIYSGVSQYLSPRSTFFPTCPHANMSTCHHIQGTLYEPQQHHHTTTPHTCRPRAAVRTFELGNSKYIRVHIGCEQSWSHRIFWRFPSDEPVRVILQPYGMLYVSNAVHLRDQW